MLAEHPNRDVTVHKSFGCMLLNTKGQVGTMANVRGFQGCQEIVIHPGRIESDLL